MSAGNEFTNLSFVTKEKREELSGALNNYVERQKNFNRLNTIVTTDCSKRCLANMKTDKINSDENVCLTNCFQRFYDTLELGESLYESLRTKGVNLNMGNTSL